MRRSGYDEELIGFLCREKVRAPFHKRRWIAAIPDIFKELAQTRLFEISETRFEHKPFRLAARRPKG